MKFLKGMLAAVGLVGLVAGGVYLGMTAFAMKEVMGAANANRSQSFPSPMNKIYLSVGLAALGALLLGLGLGLPALTKAGLRKQIAAESVHREVPAERKRHVGVDPEPTQADLEADEHRAN